MFEQLLEQLSPEFHSRETQFHAAHMETAIRQLMDGDLRESTRTRFLTYASKTYPSLVDILDESSIPTNDLLSLVEMSIVNGIPVGMFVRSYQKEPDTGVARIAAIMEAAKSPASEEQPKDESPSDDYDALLTKLDTPEQLKKIAQEVDSFDDIAHHYDPDDFVMTIQEHLSREERIRRKITFVKDTAKRDTAKKLALKRLSSTQTLRKRARRQAIDMLKSRLAKKPVSQMTVSEKERFEDIIAKRKDIINRLANKIVPRMRKLEHERLHKEHINEDAGPKGLRSNSADMTEYVEIGADGKEVIRKHSTQAVYDDGGVDQDGYIAK